MKSTSWAAWAGIPGRRTAVEQREIVDVPRIRSSSTAAPVRGRAGAIEGVTDSDDVSVKFTVGSDDPVRRGGA